NPIVLSGHSLGGMLARSIASNLLDSGRMSEERVKVIMFDSWTIGTEKLKLDLVENYLKNQFSIVPDSEKLLEAALQLSRLLVQHKFKFDPRIEVLLFKAKELTDSPLRHAILPILTEELLTSIIDNGWSEFAENITTVFTPGDHDSMLKLENLRQIREELNSAVVESAFEI
ncbi:hypothetical protein FO519_010668, partial [Halicephalobus sp. NKZ332]